MPSPNLQRLIEIVGEAMRLPRGIRPNYVRDECPLDADRAEALSLLRALEKAEGFMETPTAADAVPGQPGAGELPGSLIGRYKLLEQIGEGGFGVVFMAEQQEPVRRLVALKIIKLGMDTRTVIARFEAERQALAMMDHPNIARVLDAGATQAGRPYFVMELVKGRPITKYCDEQHLTIPQRLELFAQVCRAVQHAHAKGVIHRDIKPSNIIVGEHDGRATAKVIDFGIAKATNRRLTEKTLFTEFRQLVGTPEYMSPEQAAGDLDIDTRTDVYSLGVVMYELLTGATPFDGARLRSAAFAEMQRIIQEDRPPQPSTKFSRESEKLGPIAQRRGTEPRKLSAILRGELDWIVMRAMEKDRSRRYETPGNLGADVERFLTGQAVEAAPPSTGYRVRTFVRRHRKKVIAGALVAASLVAGMIATSLALVEAKTQRDRAIDAEIAANKNLLDVQKAKGEVEKARDDAVKAKEEAERFSRIASAVTEFFTRDVLDLQPQAPGTPEVTVREVLERVPEKIKENFSKDPAVEGSIRERVGQIYLNMGQPRRAVEFLEQGYKLLEKGLGSERRSTLTAAQRLAQLWFALEENEKAAELFGKVYEARLKVLGPNDNFTWNSLIQRGNALVHGGKFKEGLADLDKGVNEMKRVAGEYHRYHLIAIRNQIECYTLAGRAVESEVMARDALDAISHRQEELGAAEPSFRLVLADSLLRQQRLESALVEVDAALAGRVKEYPPEHSEMLDIRSTRGQILQALGRFAEARDEYRRCYDLFALNYGADAPSATRHARRLWEVAKAMNDEGMANEWSAKARAGGGAAPDKR